MPKSKVMRMSGQGSSDQKAEQAPGLALRGYSRDYRRSPHQPEGPSLFGDDNRRAITLVSSAVTNIGEKPDVVLVFSGRPGHGHHALKNMCLNGGLTTLRQVYTTCTFQVLEDGTGLRIKRKPVFS